MRMQEIMEATGWLKDNTDEAGNLTLYHGGPVGIEQLRTDRSSNLIGAYLTPSKKYAARYTKTNQRSGIVYVVRVTGRIINLNGTEISKMKAITQEANKVANERYEAYSQEHQVFDHKIRQKFFHQAYRDVFKQHGYVGRAFPDTNEIIIYDPAAMEIIDRLDPNKRGPRKPKTT